MELPLEIALIWSYENNKKLLKEGNLTKLVYDSFGGYLFLQIKMLWLCHKMNTDTINEDIIVRIIREEIVYINIDNAGNKNGTKDI